MMLRRGPDSRALRRALRPLRAAVRRWRWPALAVLALTAFGLGYWGFSLHFSETGEARSTGDRIYLAVQLFAIDSGAVDPPVPWPLQIARFLAAFVSIAVGLGALVAIFRDQVDRLRLRVRPRPVAVLGLGPYGSLLARNFAGAGYRVTGVESAATPAADECRGDGVAVAVGDASDRALLGSIGLHRADVVIIVCGDEATNVEVAVRIAEQLQREHARRWRQRRGRTRPVRCFVHIENQALCAFLRDSPLVRTASGEVLELEFFNPSQLAAPAMLDEHDVLDPGASQRLLVGVGQMGRQVALLMARSWWFCHRKPLRLTIVDREVEARWDRLLAMEPELETYCTADRVQRDVEDPLFPSTLSRADGSDPAPTVSAAYVCLDTDAHAMMAALSIRNLLDEAKNRAPVVVRMLGSAGLGSMLDPASKVGASGVRLYALADRSCRPEMLLDRDTERLARILHDDYCRERAREGKTADEKPAMRPWDELTTEFRESSRDQARDVDRKLWTVRCVRRPLADFVGELARFDDDEVELLGRMEHDRWWDFQRRWGYRYGKERTGKRHPDMVPWNDLDDDIREYDRKFVRGLPFFLLRTGYLVERLAAVLDRVVREIEEDDAAGAPDHRDGRGSAYVDAFAQTGWEVRIAGGGPERPVSGLTPEAVERILAAVPDGVLRPETVQVLPARLARIDVGVFHASALTSPIGRPVESR